MARLRNATLGLTKDSAARTLSSSDASGMVSQRSALARASDCEYPSCRSQGMTSSTLLLTNRLGARSPTLFGRGSACLSRLITLAPA